MSAAQLRGEGMKYTTTARKIDLELLWTYLILVQFRIQVFGTSYCLSVCRSVVQVSSFSALSTRVQNDEVLEVLESWEYSSTKRRKGEETRTTKNNYFISRFGFNLPLFLSSMIALMIFVSLVWAQYTKYIRSIAMLDVIPKSTKCFTIFQINFYFYFFRMNYTG